jgi:pimeloyl-ACP methyl ester carboxylesterase
MPVERTELTAGDASFTAELELPEDDGDHGAVLLSGANHTAFDDAVFDRLAVAAADRGVQFLRYQTWDSGEELSAKPRDELTAEVDAALAHLRDRGCSRVSLVGKSAGGAIALEDAPDGADEMVLWAPAVFLEGGDVLAELDIPEDAEPATIAASELADVDVPVDVLQGDEDNFPVANARELAAELPDAAVHVVEGADHSFVGGDPEDETVETTLELLSRPVGER